MTLTNVLPTPATAPRARETASDAMRRRALERLYERKAAVDDLIESLECYQRCRAVQSALYSAYRDAEVLVRLRSIANLTSPTKS